MRPRFAPAPPPFARPSRQPGVTQQRPPIGLSLGIRPSPSFKMRPGPLKVSLHARAPFHPASHSGKAPPRRIGPPGPWAFGPWLARLRRPAWLSLGIQLSPPRPRQERPSFRPPFTPGKPPPPFGAFRSLPFRRFFPSRKPLDQAGQPPARIGRSLVRDPLNAPPRQRRHVPRHYPKSLDAAA